jgi:hypothetical protein
MAFAALYETPRRIVGQIDRVVLSFVLIITAVAVVSPAQAWQSLQFTAAALVSILPFFLLSVAVAAYAKATSLDQQIARVFKGRPGSTIVAASLFGALSPFCSCGVIPITAALLRAGVPLAPVMAFWIASPLMDPEMFVLTAAVLGGEFAVARTIAAIAIGLGAGFATLAMMKRPAFASPLLSTGGGGCCGSNSLENKAIQWAFWREGVRTKEFVEESKTTGWFLLKWLTLAFLLESLMLAYLPAETMAQYLGSDSWWLLPGAAVLGVPSYLNGYAAIPMVSGLFDMGMTMPAALTFMIAGGVTSIPAAMAVFPLVKRPVFAWYVGIGLAGALFAGYGYQLALSL